MRTVEECIMTAFEFDDLAAQAADLELKALFRLGRSISGVGGDLHTPFANNAHTPALGVGEAQQHDV